jgi:hypothetical protein
MSDLEKMYLRGGQAMKEFLGERDESTRVAGGPG